MKIIRTTSFERAYHKLSEENQLRVETILRIFEQNPYDPRLYNHKLSGAKKGIRGTRPEVCGFFERARLRVRKHEFHSNECCTET